MKRGVVVAALIALATAGSANAARVTPAERAAINRTLDGFVNHAVKRQNPDIAWNLVTPEFRGGISRKAWDKGNVPVYPYPAGGTAFHGWTVDAASPSEVEFELMVPSRRSKSDSIQFTGTMRKVGGRWLVDSFNPAATFAGSGTVVGPSDFTASASGDTKGVARLGSVWIAIPLALIVGGILLVGGGFLFVAARNRRAYKKAYHRPLEPIVIRRRDSEPALVAKERPETDG